VAVASETGRELGPWVDVEVDRTTSPGRCFYVVRRPDGTLWAIDSSKVTIR
jgi:hypothetical protein